MMRARKKSPAHYILHNTTREYCTKAFIWMSHTRVSSTELKVAYSTNLYSIKNIQNKCSFTSLAIFFLFFFPGVICLCWMAGVLAVTSRDLNDVSKETATWCHTNFKRGRLIARYCTSARRVIEFIEFILLLTISSLSSKTNFLL